MRLKCLEIIGFKSFPNKCVIEFPPGVSAIVGPNGCGKSNVIDAIKWVMGEQSIKQLRGKAMGDVIFAGTDKRPPLNMAEVSLTITNDTPVQEETVRQLTEIMITRRLYRSGESAYLINKQPGRLKDIHNLFLASGMGSKSCAIVQQGTIGAITEATPEERRAYIEDTAGVTRYKTRKNEALAKLNATNQNLLRLNDLIEEIKKQMNSLRRQANKARQYKAYREQFKQTDILVSVYHHEEHAIQIEKTEKILKDLKEKDSRHVAELERLHTALEKIKAQRLVRDQEISRKKTESVEVQRKIDKLENDIEHIQNEKNRLAEEITGLEEALLGLEEKSQNIKNEIAEESERQAAFNEKITGITASIERENQAFEQRREKLEALGRDSEESRKNLINLMAQKTRYQDINRYAESNKENIRRRLEQLQGDEAKSARKVSDLTRAVQQATDQLNEIDTRRKETEDRITTTKQALQEKNQALGIQVKALNALLNDRNNAKSRHAALKKMDENYDWYKDGVKAIMKSRASAAEGGAGFDADGIVGVTGDAIEPEPGFEFAVEAVLGEALQYILVRDPETGIASINYLKTSNAGRSGFIPVSLFDAFGQDPVADAEGLDFLINHVAIKPEYEKPVFDLLNQVAVTDNMETALRVWHQHNGFKKVVTRNGDVISSNGIMIGGSREKLSGIYEKKLELKQLQTTISKIAQAIDTQQELINRLETDVRRLENDLQKKIVEKNEIEHNALDAEKRRFTASESLKHAVSQLELLRLEKEKLAGEKNDVENEISKHDEALAGLSFEIQSVEGTIKNISDAMISVKSEMEAVDQKRMELRLAQTRLNAEIENTSNTLNRLNQFQTDGFKQIEQIQRDIAIKRQKKENTARDVFEYEKNLSTAREFLNRLNLDLKTDETAYQGIVDEISKTDGSISDTRKYIGETQQQIHELEIEISRHHINRENVVNRFLEKYALSFTGVLAAHRDQVRSSDFSIEKMESELSGYRKKIEGVGEVNLGAIEAYDEQKSRHDFLAQQRDDLVEALSDLENLIRKINRVTQTLFMRMFNHINEQLKHLFPRLFQGGEAWLELTEPGKPLDAGVEFMIHLHGKKLSRLSLLSGGEKALAAIAFIFSMFLINPSAYCLLDEIDAALDEASIHRFNELLRIIGEKSQVLMITHNKKSMEFADILFGITMGEKGVSKLVSVDIEKLTRENRKTEKGAADA